MTGVAREPHAARACHVCGTCKIPVKNIVTENAVSPFSLHYIIVSQSVVLGFCPCGPLRLNISLKKTEKIKLTWIAFHSL
jgi:hypothetical protein